MPLGGDNSLQGTIMSTIRVIHALAMATGMLFLAPVGAEAAKPKKKKKGPDLAAVFAKLDTDKDQKLTVAEFAKVGSELKKKPAATDAKKAGKAGKKAGTLFTKLDGDKNGYLSLDEFKKIGDGKKDKKKPK